MTMAAIRVPSAAFWETFLPIARAQLLSSSNQPVIKRIPLLQRLRATTTLLPAALTPIPSLLSDLWDGLLNAVPKKKTSHMKKRHRQMAAGKHLKDVTALNKCSACGRAKRAHVLCPYCVKSIRRWFGTGFRSKEELEVEEQQKRQEINEERRILGKKPLKEPKQKEDGEEV